jgi:VPDSG-CTERM motif
LTGTVTIPATAGDYGLSGWTLFTPGGQTVPDNGSTIAFLGVALAAVELLRRGVTRRAVKA